MEILANWFNVDPDEDGNYDIDDYEWTAGCSMGPGDKWLCLAEVVRCLENSL